MKNYKKISLLAPVFVTCLLVSPVYGSFFDHAPEEPKFLEKSLEIVTTDQEQKILTPGQTQELSLVVYQPEQSQGAGMPAFRPTDISATVSLAEFHEILSKTKEDLEERIGKLDPVNSAEIIKILENKKMIITTQLQEMERLGGHIQLLESIYSKNQQSNRLFWFVTIMLTGSTVGALALTSYDYQHGWTWPQQETARRNFEKICEKIKALIPQS